MRRIVLCICILCFTFGIICVNVNAGEKTEEININLEVTYYASGDAQGDFDVNVYFDDELLSAMKKGTVLHKDVKTKKGKHKITFKKAKDESIEKADKIDIEDEKYIVYSIHTKQNKIRGYRCKTDMQILQIKDHPKCLQEYGVGTDAWEFYNHKRVSLADGEKDIIPGNIIAKVGWNDSDRINKICIPVSSVDGIDKYVKDVDSAIEFAKDYIELKKLAKYYTYKKSFVVKDTNSKAKKYVIKYVRNDKGKKKGYPKKFIVEIKKDKKGKIKSINMLPKGTRNYKDSKKKNWKKKL